MTQTEPGRHHRSINTVQSAKHQDFVATVTNSWGTIRPNGSGYLQCYIIVSRIYSPVSASENPVTMSSDEFSSLNIRCHKDKIAKLEAVFLGLTSEVHCQISAHTVAKHLKLPNSDVRC